MVNISYFQANVNIQMLYYSANQIQQYVIPAKAGIQTWMPFGIYPALDAGIA